VIQPVVGVRSVFLCSLYLKRGECFCNTVCHSSEKCIYIACSWSKECVFVIQPVVGIRSVFLIHPVVGVKCMFL
jgi:hypothetical protein